MLCMAPYVEPRRTAIAVVESLTFERLILLAILTNCVTMAISPARDAPTTILGLDVAMIDFGILLVYSVEQLLKMFAYSCHSENGSFHRDTWACFESAIVAASW